MEFIHNAIFFCSALLICLFPLLGVICVSNEDEKEGFRLVHFIILFCTVVAAIYIDCTYIYPKTPEGMEKAKLESMSVDYESGVGNGEKIASDFYLKQIKYNNDLYYDDNTGVVYIKITNPKGPDTVSNYYSANGKICKYDPETNTISEME